VVISLSDYGSEYRGGIYVAHGRASKRNLPLSRGDAVAHQSDLLHGVKVRDDGGERWSWVLWYRDSARCEDHSAEWYEPCAHEGGEGSAICQHMHANTRIGSEEPTDDGIAWLQRAAEQGLASSMVKLARAHLKQLGSRLAFSPTEAERLYREAIHRADEPDAHFGLAQLLLQKGPAAGATPRQLLNEVVALLEAAAKGGHEYAMFNLGIAHLYGYAEGGVEGGRDVELAGQWFEACGLAEGFEAASMYYASTGDQVKAQEYKRRAATMGYGTAWRRTARQHVGSGGAGGVELNMAWPTLAGGVVPPAW